MKVPAEEEGDQEPMIYRYREGMLVVELMDTIGSSFPRDQAAQGPDECGQPVAQLPTAAGQFEGFHFLAKVAPDSIAYRVI